MTRQELALAAGLMEGEGTVRITAFTRRNKGALIVCMTNTDRQILDWLAARWRGTIRPCSGMRPDQRPAWRWQLAANQALGFLLAIKPFVITTRMRERIETAEWWQQIKSKHWQLREEPDFEASFACWHYMSELNRRGVETCPHAKQHRKGK